MTIDQTTSSDKSLNIKNSSICFAVPFRLDDTSIMRQYFETAAKGDYLEAKETFLKEFNCKVKKPTAAKCINCENCPDEVFGDYKNYACRCLRLSNKFHDDYKADDKVLQVSLGQTRVIYRAPIIGIKKFNKKYFKLSSIDSAAGYSCSFKVKVILHITCDEKFEKSTGNGDKKCNYADDIKYGVQLLFIVDDAGKSVNDIIFTKHLFYKNGLKCEINGVRQSILQWATGIRDNIITQFKDGNSSSSIKNLRFDSSFAEVSVEDNMNDLHQNHHREICGMLTSNEEYPYITDDYTSKTLATKWQCYGSSQHYFLSNNILNIRNDDAEKLSDEYVCEWFVKYTRDDEDRIVNKYIDRTLAENCIVGLKDILLFDYLDFNKKRFVLLEAIDRSARLFLSNSDDVSFEDIQLNQNVMNSIIAAYPHDAIGRGTLNKCLEIAFNITKLSEELKEYYARSSSLIESKYNKNTNDLVVNISIVAVVVTIGLFVLGFIFDRDYNYSAKCKVLSVIICVIALIVILVIKKQVFALYKRIMNSSEKDLVIFLLAVILCLAVQCICQLY